MISCLTEPPLSSVAEARTEMNCALFGTRTEPAQAADLLRTPSSSSDVHVAPSSKETSSVEPVMVVPCFPDQRWVIELFRPASSRAVQPATDPYATSRLPGSWAACTGSVARLVMSLPPRIGTAGRVCQGVLRGRLPAVHPAEPQR